MARYVLPTLVLYVSGNFWMFAALDVTITHPLQDTTRAKAATPPGHAMVVAFENKCRVTEELCREQGITFNHCGQVSGGLAPGGLGPVQEVGLSSILGRRREKKLIIW